MIRKSEWIILKSLTRYQWENVVSTLVDHALYYRRVVHFFVLTTVEPPLSGQ